MIPLKLNSPLNEQEKVKKTCKRRRWKTGCEIDFCVCKLKIFLIKVNRMTRGGKDGIWSIKHLQDIQEEEGDYRQRGQKDHPMSTCIQKRAVFIQRWGVSCGWQRYWWSWLQTTAPLWITNGSCSLYIFLPSSSTSSGICLLLLLLLLLSLLCGLRTCLFMSLDFSLNSIDTRCGNDRC